MALTYERVIRVISQTPDKRKDFEVNNLLPWFRKKSDLFRNLKTELLFDIIKNLQFSTKERDDVIIRQGDKGECMYILLRGQVTIFIQYATKSEDTDDRPPKPKPEPTAPDQAAPTAPTPASAQEESELIRKRLGTYVCSLVPGATFGEVALLSEDCIRTASIITDERTDLIVVDRQLYNRSVKYVLQKEFEDKSTFIATNPLFRGWAPRYHKQLTMALQKDICGYEGVLVKQGAPVTAIYFILSGEVKVVMDPQQHKTQYPRFREHFAKDDRILATSSEQNGLADTPDSEDYSPRVSREQTNGFVQFQYRRRPTKKQLVEVCLLGVNESVGDAEVLLDLDTYMQTVICTQKTDVLVLEMKHYERLLAKRNPRTIDKMMENLEVKLDSRLTKHLELSLPLVGLLLDKARVHNIQRRRQRLARQMSRQDRRQQTGPTRKTMANSFDNFVPTHGALVDMYGPGTVFHHIRKREQAKAQKEQKRQQIFGGGTFRNMTVAPPGGGGGGDGDVVQLVTTTVSQSIDYKTSDPVLTHLEDRIRSWLSHGITPSPRTQQPTRVTKLYRSPTVEVQKRTVVVRANGNNVDQSYHEPSSGQQVATDQSVSDQKEVVTWVESLEDLTTLPDINMTPRSMARRSKTSSSISSEDEEEKMMFDGASWARRSKVS